MVAAQKVALNNGVLMGQLGFGMGRVPPPEAAFLAYSALEFGFRHIDTAALYGNEPGIGEAVRSFISEGSASRENIFLTTKVWNDNQGYDATLRGFDDSLQQLGLDYVDLYLIHWPLPRRGLFMQTLQAWSTSTTRGGYGLSASRTFCPNIWNN